MTLYRQFSLTIVALFTASFLIAVTISTNNLRGFLVEQLAKHAQDTATSLGLSLSPYLKRNDVALMNAMIDAIFDRGHYEIISLIASDGSRLIERSNSATNPDIPSWFVKIFDLRPSPAEAVVLSGWKPAATITVTAYPGQAYRELWKHFRNTFLLFLLTAVAAIVLGIAAVYLLLKPLKQIEEQAGAICRKNFVTQKVLPRTRELRRVVQAMNHLSRKINEIFVEQASLTERLRIEAYQDEVTGLGNRRYFNRRFQALLEAREESSTGLVLLLELQHLARINARSGYQAGDELLRNVAQQLNKRFSGFRKCFLSRISGAGFGVVIEDIDGREADALADSLSRDLLQTGTEASVEAGSSIAIGLAMWQAADAMSEVLAGADIALRSAQAAGRNAWRRYTPPNAPKAPVLDVAHWHAYLTGVIRSENVALCAQSVHLFDRSEVEVFHREIFLCLPDADGKFITAGAFMGRAERSELACDLDKLVVEKLIGHVISDPDNGGRYALNLTTTSLHDASFVDWLCSRLAAAHGIAQRVAIEFPEIAVLRDIQSTRRATERISEQGCDCGIDHFGHGFSSFGYLRSLRVNYLKIDASYSRNIHQEMDNQFFLKTLADTAHSVGIRVFAAAIESEPELEATRRLNIDGAQGYLVGKPEPL